MTATYIAVDTIGGSNTALNDVVLCVASLQVSFTAFLSALDTLEATVDLLDGTLDALTAPATDLSANLEAVLEQLDILLGMLDFVLNAQFGLVPLKFNAALEFHGALSAAAGLSFSVSNPLGAISSAIAATAQALANLQASLALGLPTVSAELGVQLSAITAVAAAAQIKMAGIQLVIDGLLSAIGPAIAVKTPALSAVATFNAAFDSVLAAQIDLGNALLSLAPLRADLEASVSVCGGLASPIEPKLASGGVHLTSVDTTVGSIGTDLQTVLDGGGIAGLPGGASVRGLLLLVNTGTHSSTWTDLQDVLRTS